MPTQITTLPTLKLSLGGEDAECQLAKALLNSSATPVSTVTSFCASQQVVGSEVWTLDTSIFLDWQDPAGLCDFLASAVGTEVAFVFSPDGADVGKVSFTGVVLVPRVPSAGGTAGTPSTEDYVFPVIGTPVYVPAT